MIKAFPSASRSASGPATGLMLSALCSLLALPLAGTAEAAAIGPGPVPLQTWPAAKVKALAPLLRSADTAVIESQPNGRLKQLSLFTLIAAPPAVVRDTLLKADHYAEFARNFTKSKVSPRPDSSFDHVYELSYGMFSIDGTHRYVPQPASASEESGAPEAPPIEVMDEEEPAGSQRHYRWEFHAVGAATVLAVYGYTDLWHSGGVVAKLLERVPQLEHGLALVSQAALVLAIKQRSEQLTSPPSVLPAAGGAPYDALLDRGVVVLLRSQGGRLSEVSLIDRSLAQPNQVLDVVRKPTEWSQFIPTITKSADGGQRDDIALVDMEQSLPLLSFHTVYGARVSGHTVDMMGLSGDLRGARMRWEVLPGRGAVSQIVIRSSQQLDKGSMVIRQLYKLEPFFEYGVNVGMQLVVLRGLKTKAEQLVATNSARAQ